jgi:surface protein
MDVYQSPFSLFARSNQLHPCRGRDRSCPEGRRVFDTKADIRNAVTAYLISPIGPPPNCWDVSRVTDMSFLFDEVTNFNEPIGNWDTSAVTDMALMFAEASSFNQDIGDWDTSNVGRMLGMFAGASSFNQDISGWDVSAATTLEQMFLSATSFNQNMCAWKDITAGANQAFMFFDTSCPFPGTPDGTNFCTPC